MDFKARWIELRILSIDWLLYQRCWKFRFTIRDLVGVGGRIVQTGSAAHSDSFPMGTGGSFPGAKARPGRDADHSLPSSAEVENE
jgi:hypothetical protein